LASKISSYTTKAVPLVSGALPLQFKSKKSSYGLTSKLADKNGLTDRKARK